MRLLGLDPGLRVTGWGVIDATDNRLRFVAEGTVATDGALSLGERLYQLFEGVSRVIAEFDPVEAAVEQTFVNKNPESTLKLGQARGAVVVAASSHTLHVHEYTPATVKKAVVGTGAAAKEQVQMMVRRLLPGCTGTSADAFDALAVAVCHAHHRASAVTLAGARAR